MGRIRTTLIKRTGENLVKKFPDKFQANFEHNKIALNDGVEIHSKKLRNLIAGYITHLVKHSK
ncbi:30S ribosomal protein S17e [Candidatus Woesearchaeota archaeon]|nr:30S ribosomal protein S17e [Candidatus Woesearchaeota archaeon]